MKRHRVVVVEQGNKPMRIAASKPFAAWVALTMSFLPALALMISFMLIPLPAMAIISAPYPIAFGTMSNKTDAAAKNLEGKLESAYGEATGDTGHQIKGKAKQVQASAMNAAEDVKQGVRSAAKNVADATEKLADDLK